MVFSQVRYLLTILMLFIFSACFQGPGILKFDSGNIVSDSVAITSPVLMSVIPSNDLSSISVSGTCSKDGDVTITALSETEIATCSAGAWSTTLDLSSWTAGNPTITASMTQTSHAVPILIDDEGPVVSLLSPSVPVSQFSDEQDYSWTSNDLLSETRATQTYLVEAFANGTCAGVPYQSGNQDSETITLSGMMDGTSYSVRVRAYDEYDFEGTASCFSEVTIDQTAPTLALSDATTTSTSLIRQVAAKAVITNSTTVKKWCLSETLSAPPLITDTCFVSVKPTAINLTAGDGAKTAYLWVADSAGTILSSSVTDSITLDTTLPATPVVTLTGVESASTTFTNVALNTLAITVDTDAVRWCEIEVAGAASSPTKPAFDDTCFVSSRPVTHTLSGRGSRKVYVFTSDSAGNISAGGFSTFDFPVPTAAAVTGPAKVFTYDCSPPVTITAKDVNGLTSPADSALSFTLSDGAAGGTFYSDSGCVTAVTAIAIGSGATTATFYYKKNTIGSHTLTATAGTITDTHAISIVPPNLVSPGKNGTTCATLDGAAYCWGLNSGTNFGVPDYRTTKAVPLAIPTLATSVTQIETGLDHGCAVQNGAAKCWGQSWAGQTGNNATTPQDTPATPVGLETGITHVSAGFFHSCAVKNGAGYCWGWNPYGQVGDNSTTNALIPVALTGLSSGVTKIVTGSHFTCALQNGGVKCWGNNASGSIGDGSFTTRLTPTPVSNLTSDVTDLVVGDFHACAIKSGAVKCWGAGWSGQLGDGTQINSNVPVQVQGLTAGATSLIAGAASACAVVAGEVWCWGIDIHGQRGDGTISNWSGLTVEKITTLTGFENLRAGGNNTCAMFSGVPKCWGVNAGNELGTGALESTQLPLTARGVTGTTVALAAGNTTCAVSSAGTIQCWGSGENAQIGDGAVIHRNAPRTVSNIANGATKVSTGVMSACAVVSGGVRCWGRNDESQLGTAGWRIDAPAAYTIAAGSLATDVSVSNSGSLVCAVVNGGAKCWGENTVAPYDVPGLGSGSGVTKVAVGNKHACALLTTGAVSCWGANTYSQIGIGTTSASEPPMEPISIGATDISAAGDYSCAVVSSDLRCWGQSNSGQAGYVGNKTTPFTVNTLNGTVSQVRSAPLFSCVVTTTGTVKCFGRNTERQLGYTGGDTSGPQTVIGLSSVTELSVGNEVACAIMSNSTKCWGANLFGVLSDASSVAEPNPMSIVLPADVRTVIVTAPASVALNTCSNAFSITLSATVAAATSMSLNSSDGLFYPASSSCDVAAITSVNVAAGASTAQFKFRATSSGTKNISAKGARTSRGLATYSVTP